MAARAYIICIDDEQAVLNQLSAQLTRGFGSTHLVECTESAEEALELMDEISAAGGEVEMVICDQIMPGMKGDRFLETVHASHPEVMKILLTGQAGLDSAIYAINNAGLHRYIEKPWEPEDLTLAIQNLLTQYRLRKDLALHHERLERRSRELHALHELGLSLGTTAEPERILALTTSAARNLSGAREAASVVHLGSREAPLWSGRLVFLEAAVRRGLEASLARLRAERRRGLPEALPAATRAVLLARSDVLFGWILLSGAPEPSQDTLDLLSVLAGQASASLSNVQLLEERIESERLTTIGRMMTTIVHDFRNPMTAVKGYAGMIQEFDLTPERRRECARLMTEECDRMNAMIDEILEFTRGGPGRLRLTPITVEELVAKILRLIEPEFREKGVAVATDLAYPGSVVVDVDRMKRALLNIASNALDAMEAGGTFTLASRLEDAAVELALSDTGHGILEELQPRIFEPFFTHGKARGIGLGMSIARKIVEEHGGRIHVKSRPGGGTCFTLLIPLEPSGSPLEPLSPVEQPPH